MSLDAHYQHHLTRYLRKGRRGRANGVAHLQRICGIGYNQACHTLEYGIAQGLLARDAEQAHLHHIVAPALTPNAPGLGALLTHIAALEELIGHMWVHTGYPENGRREMTTAQKALYQDVIDRQSASLDT